MDCNCYVDWSSLPCDILVMVLERLSTEDLVRSKSVCRDWRSTPTRKRSVPWLLDIDRPVNVADTFKAKYCMIRDCFENSDLVTEKKIEVPIGRVCSHMVVGSLENGWILHVNESQQLRGFNLRTNEKFKLPPYSTMWKKLYKENNIWYQFENPNSGFRWNAVFYEVPVTGYVKALTCSSVGKKKNVTVVIDKRSQYLAFAVEGDTSWTILQTDIGGFEDIMYSSSSGLFYGLNSIGQMVTCDFSDPSSPPKTKSIIPRKSLEKIRYDYTMHLFELSGEIWYIATLWRDARVHLTRGTRLTLKVRVFLGKLVRSDDGCFEWKEMSGLGDHALFVGVNNSMCLSATTDHRHHLPPNHVFYDSSSGEHSHTGENYWTILRKIDLNDGCEQEVFEVPGKDLERAITPWVMPFLV